MIKVRKIMFGKCLLIIEKKCLLEMTFRYEIARLPLDASLWVTQDYIFQWVREDGAQGPEEEKFLMLDWLYL